MFKGFYNLGSAMLTQNRNLDVIGNNMSNTAVSGYKSDRYVDTTFGEFMLSRVGNRVKNPQELGSTTTYMTTIGEVSTDFTQGALEKTDLPLDFAIQGDGFFGIQTENGVQYTRNGSFMLDDEGYLYLGGRGRVLGADSQPIQLGIDDIKVDTNGYIMDEQGTVLAQIGMFTFENPNESLTKGEGNMYSANAQPQLSQDSALYQGMVENSNVDLVEQMTEMMTCQRALQSASQLTKMYDSLMTKATTEIGKM